MIKIKRWEGRCLGTGTGYQVWDDRVLIGMNTAKHDTARFSELRSTAFGSDRANADRLGVQGYGGLNRCIAILMERALGPKGTTAKLPRGVFKLALMLVVSLMVALCGGATMIWNDSRLFDAEGKELLGMERRASSNDFCLFCAVTCDCSEKYPKKQDFSPENPAFDADLRQKNRNLAIKIVDKLVQKGAFKAGLFVGELADIVQEELQS
jgi:hypothetical protein